jgi:nitrite reductase/ring-hydroxylating ferredoxin subunit
MFSLDDGRVMRPPATKPVPVYDVRVEDGRVSVRLRDES